MIEPCIPVYEDARMASLKSINFKAAHLRTQFDSVVNILSKCIDVPIAYISSIDTDTQNIHASCGLKFSTSARSNSFCGHTILEEHITVVEDTLKDERFWDNPLVTNGPKIRFYAGYPLQDEQKYSIGALCIADTKPRKLTKEDIGIFKTIGKLLAERIQMSKLAAIHDQIRDSKMQLEHLNQELKESNSFYKDLFGKYMSESLLESIMANEHTINLDGEERVVTILMSDIRGFTPLVHERPPHEVLDILNIYLESMIRIINEHDGYVNEILGDGILVIFGAPKHVENCAIKAVQCARAMQEELVNVNHDLNQKGLPCLEMGIGINSGKTVVGNIGSKQRMKFGVVGENINIASRVQALAFAKQILVTESTYNVCQSKISPLGSIRTMIKGYQEPITIYDVSQ